MVRAALSHRLSISVHSTSRTRFACPSCVTCAANLALRPLRFFSTFFDSPAQLLHFDDIFTRCLAYENEKDVIFLRGEKKSRFQGKNSFHVSIAPLLPRGFIDKYITRRIISLNEFFESLSLVVETLLVFRPNFFSFIINTAYGRNR